MSMIKETYDRFIRQIEAEKNIKVGKVTITDDHGIVAIRVLPKLNEIALDFTNSGEQPSEPLPDEEDDIIATPTEDGEGIIIEWGPSYHDDHELVMFSTKQYNVYRSKNGGAFEKVATASNGHTDTPLASGTYQYYVVQVVDGKEGIPSKAVTVIL